MCGQHPDEVNFCFCRHRCSCISLISSGIRRNWSDFTEYARTLAKIIEYDDKTLKIDLILQECSRSY